MSDSSTTAFTNTNVYGGIYFYTYAVICIAIIIGGFYFSSKYKLYYESYQLLHDIENEFGIATLGIKALEIKYNVNNKGDKKCKREINHVRYEVKTRFKKIREKINKHEQALNKKIDKIEKLQNVYTQSTKNANKKTASDKKRQNNNNENEMGLKLYWQLDPEMNSKRKKTADMSNSKLDCDNAVKVRCTFQIICDNNIVICCLYDFFEIQKHFLIPFAS